MPQLGGAEGVCVSCHICSAYQTTGRSVTVCGLQPPDVPLGIIPSAVPGNAAGPRTARVDSVFIL